MKLISISDFVLLSNGIVKSDNEESRTLKNTSFDSIVKYAEFLKQPLTLGMFVPCYENGELMDKPLKTYSPNLNRSNLYAWVKAREKVLFKGFYVEFNAVKSPQGGFLDVGNLKNKTIETIVGAELELTETAIKQIGLNP